MSSRPRIGLTARSPRALHLLQRHLALIGASMVVLEPWAPRPELRRSYETLDGVILPGGAGMVWVWQQYRRRTGAGPRRAGWTERDSADCQLASWALADGRPLLGICRGVQMMALAVGGQLDSNVAGHQTVAFPAHRIEIGPGSRLGEAVGTSDLKVNSRHHRAVRSLPPGAGLMPVAWAEDGVVEAIEACGPGFAIGVQYHPEDLFDDDEPSRQLFRAFVASCRRAVS